MRARARMCMCVYVYVVSFIFHYSRSVSFLRDVEKYHGILKD